MLEANHLKVSGGYHRARLVLLGDREDAVFRAALLRGLRGDHRRSNPRCALRLNATSTTPATTIDAPTSAVTGSAPPVYARSVSVIPDCDPDPVATPAVTAPASVGPVSTPVVVVDGAAAAGDAAAGDADGAFAAAGVVVGGAVLDVGTVVGATVVVGATSLHGQHQGRLLLDVVVGERPAAPAAN
ncbi:MAG: hypothetical protein M5U19_07705 [Microthrixaceae bacterium]|nr:hypothetical protein [Microthrixaceae bacterium]